MSCLICRKIHILAGGALPNLVAFALKSQVPNSNITLHFHKLSQAEVFNAVYGIRVIYPSGVHLFRDGFSYEMKDARMRKLVPYAPEVLDRQKVNEYVPAVAADKIRTLPEEAKNPPRLAPFPGWNHGIIEVLIIAKKAPELIWALLKVRYRLRRESTVVLIHNGMGVLSEVEALWRESDRPHIIEGFSTHGLSKRDEFSLDHWGPGGIHLAIAPRKGQRDIFKFESLRKDTLPPVINRLYVMDDIRVKILAQDTDSKSLIFIIRHLLQNRLLNCTLRPYTPDLYLIQLRRTILQSIISSLGAILNCTNGEVVRATRGRRIVRKLLIELYPLLQQDPTISSSKVYSKRFEPPQLYRDLQIMANATKNLLNAITQDLAGRRETEMEYYTGYILHLAKDAGIDMPTWHAIHDLVKARAEIQQSLHNSFTPVLADGSVQTTPEWTYGVQERDWKMETLDEAKERLLHPLPFDLSEEALFGDHYPSSEQLPSEPDTPPPSSTRSTISSEPQTPPLASSDPDSLSTRLKSSMAGDPDTVEHERERELISVDDFQSAISKRTLERPSETQRNDADAADTIETLELDEGEEESRTYSSNVRRGSGGRR